MVILLNNGDEMTKMMIYIFFILVFSAFAYTYTCQEGRFTIDLPEEGSVSLEQDYLKVWIKKSATYEDFGIGWGNVNDEYMKDYCGGSFDIKKFHDFIVNLYINDGFTVTSETYLSSSEAIMMGVETGFILKLDDERQQRFGFYAFFVKHELCYRFYGERGKTPKYRDVIIKTLNSFHAFD